MRSVILGPSGSGKTIPLHNMILDIDNNCFSRIYTFSPSIDVDATWRPVKKYIGEGEKCEASCPQCGSEDVYYKNGCPSCRICGHSNCS